MDSEELRLLRENNMMLKQILTYLAQQGQNQNIREFALNVLADQVSRRISQGDGSY